MAEEHKAQVTKLMHKVVTTQRSKAQLQQTYDSLQDTHTNLAVEYRQLVRDYYFQEQTAHNEQVSCLHLQTCIATSPSRHTYFPVPCANHSPGRLTALHETPCRPSISLVHGCGMPVPLLDTVVAQGCADMPCACACSSIVRLLRLTHATRLQS